MTRDSIPHSFKTTRWSVVRDAAGVGSEHSEQAISVLCDAYWYPLYAFIRRSGKSAPDAEDLTQDFFLRLLHGKILGAVEQERGKFRSYLLKCLQNFLADDHDRRTAQKRGDGMVVSSFDPVWAEERYAREPADDMTPDRIFQWRWAITLLEYALELLEQEFTEKGRGETFAALRPFLGFGTDSEKRYEEISTRLGIPAGTLQNQVYRLRARWCEILFEQVSFTLAEPTQQNIKDELMELLPRV